MFTQFESGKKKTRTFVLILFIFYWQNVVYKKQVSNDSTWTTSAQTYENNKRKLKKIKHALSLSELNSVTSSGSKQQLHVLGSICLYVSMGSSWKKAVGESRGESTIFQKNIFLKDIVLDRDIFLLWSITHKCGLSIPGGILYKCRMTSV